MNSFDERIDVKENVIATLDPKILRILLKDKSKEYIKHSTKNASMKTGIIWATDDYVLLGDGYAFSDEITISSITGENGNVIRPRVEKTKDEQANRIKNKAEVFTPSWVCNRQNNLIDNDWFGHDNVFNAETENGWVATTEKVIFPEGKTWQSYVVSKRLEISCGEAPYLVSRYDTVTGLPIPVENRIGLLDRKLRIVCENCDSEPEWVAWAVKAFKSVYGYEWQGDNVLLARENLLYTFSDYYFYKFSVPAIKEYLIDLANIIAWNIWQMDGIRCVVPNTCHQVELPLQISLFGDSEVKYEECPGCANNDVLLHNGIQCRIYDWTNLKKSIPFTSLYKGDKK